MLIFSHTTLLFSDANYENLISHVNSKLPDINNWFTNNKLSLNVDKSCWMLFSNNHINSSESDIVIDNIFNDIYLNQKRYHQKLTK